MNDVSDNPVAKFLRLQTGDDIVAQTVEYEDEDGIMYMVINPMNVVYSHTHEGYLSVSFMPWVFPRLVDHQEFMLHAEDVLLISDVTEKMNIYYWENVQSLCTPSETRPPVEEPQEEESSLIDTLKEMVTKRTYH